MNHASDIGAIEQRLAGPWPYPQLIKADSASAISAYGMVLKGEGRDHATYIGKAFLRYSVFRVAPEN